jgi:predicted N-acetyltransferase YhbS
MSELSLTVHAETANDADAIDRLHERTFGPGRFVLSSYRLRERIGHIPALSFTARIGTLLVGSVRQTPICIGDARALLLGPLTVEPPFRRKGVGRALVERSIKEARLQAHSARPRCDAGTGRSGPASGLRAGRGCLRRRVRGDQAGLEHWR